MAEGVLFNIASTILKKLGSQAVQEIGLLWGLNDELEELQRTVSTIKAVLLDAEKVYWTSNEVRLWLDDLKDAVYDADDLMDDISTEASRRQLQNGGNLVTKEVGFSCFSGSNRLGYGLEMAHKVKDIRAKLNGTAENRKFHLNKSVVEPTVLSQDRDSHSYAPSVVIGRDDDKKKIMSLLLADHEESVVVVPIVGLGGSGKTTVAQIIYNDELVKNHFELRVWICVSDSFDIKSIVEKMVVCIDGGKPVENHGLETLKNRLYEKIEGKKYLFVLDDIWNEDREKWIRLSDLIRSGARGSRIIVTTRNMAVAEITSTLQPYILKGLSELESWDLFRKVAFKQEQPPNEEFEELGKEIATKCCGLPLAIRTIGSLLYTKTKEFQWRHFKDDEFSKLDPKINILETLKLSYNQLPSNLKQCFAYCSLFPKDHIFHVYTLINYWKAHGYVDSRKEDASSEDKDLNCVNYLVQRSFLQIERENKDGEIVECKMHDFMHDLATSVAGEEVKLLVYGSSNGTTVTGKTRHMSFHEVSHEGKWPHVAPLLQGKKARTLIIKSGTYKRINGEGWLPDILDKLRYLRVLELENCMFKKLPSFIDRLKHLRQLDLSGNWYIKMLPGSITRLYNLQVLNLDRCSFLKELPKDTKKLVNLTHLGLEECGRLQEMPQGIEQLTSLEVLSRFSLSQSRRRRRASAGLEELQKLSKLRGRLELLNLQYLKQGARECEAANLKDKPHLRYLSLHWGNWRKVKDKTREEKSLEALQPHVNLLELKVKHYYGGRFPRWVSSLENLVKIEIEDCRECKSLPPLYGLPSLQHLSISMAKLEYLIDDDDKNTRRACRSCFFPSLKTLALRCFELKGWWRHSPTGTREPLPYQLPCLSKLDVCFCTDFKGWMPLLPSLDTLTLWGVSVELLEEILKQASPPCASTSTSTSTSLSPLQSLSITRIKNLGVVPRKEALQNLASLKSLEIGYLGTNTRVLSPWLHHLTSLESLSIRDCEEMNLLEEKNKELIQGLENLRSLEIRYCEEMESLPGGIQHLSALETLWIDECEELKSLTAGMGNLKSLNRLTISGCPRLRERCVSKRGEDWPFISHIPNIKVDRIPVQWDRDHRPSYRKDLEPPQITKLAETKTRNPRRRRQSCLLC